RLRTLLRNFSGGLGEELCGWTERTVPQGENSIRHAGNWQFDGERFQLRAIARKSQCRCRDNRHKASARQETNPHFGRKSDYSRARIIKSFRMKCLHGDRPDRAFRGWQNPRFVSQFDKVYLAPTHPRALRTRYDDKRVFKEEVKAQSIVRNGVPR